jgi:hypothetical protein
MSIVNEVDLLQKFCRKIPGITSSPDTEAYPAVIDTLRLPAVLTELLESRPEGSNEVNTAVDTFKILFFVAPLGTPNYGWALTQCHRVANAVREAFLNDTNNYVGVGQRLLQVQPYKIMVSLDDFTISGPQVLERPVGSDSYWHGIEVKLNLKVDWRLECESY